MGSFWIGATVLAADATGPVVMQLPSASACETTILACNRLALDDARTQARIDPQRREIRITNAADYRTETIVADVLLHGREGGEAGGRPHLVHLVVSKKGGRWKHRLSPYTLDTRKSEGPFAIEDWTVFVGDQKKPLLSPELARKAMGHRSLSVRATDFLVRSSDLRAKPGEAPAVELKLQMGPLKFGLTRARFEPPASWRQNGPGADLSAALAKEDWSFDFQSLSKLVPADLIRHDLFLFDLDTHPLMAQAITAGYRGTERLRVGVRQGAGYVQLDDRVEPYAQAPQTAKTFLRDTYLGMLLSAQASAPVRN